MKNLFNFLKDEYENYFLITIEDLTYIENQKNRAELFQKIKENNKLFPIYAHLISKKFYNNDMLLIYCDKGITLYKIYMLQQKIC